MACVHVIRPGLQTTIQDRGRWGWQGRGVSVGGAMDPDSCRVANALVGNHPDDALLEIAFAGPELEFDDRRQVAAAGAEFSMRVDRTAAPMYEAVPVSAGSRLTFGTHRRGARIYLAIGGGIAVPEVLGSRSTHLVSRMGGFAGRSLGAGDRVPLAPPPAIPVVLKTPVVDVLKGCSRLSTSANGSTIARVRVIADSQLDRLEERAIDVLQSAPYTIGPLSDRMGFRLEGPGIRPLAAAGGLSDITPLGTVQVPESGQPILLMAERQTTGGYARIATIISADIGLAGQLGPGDQLAFELCTLAESLAARIPIERALMAAEKLARA